MVIYDFTTGVLDERVTFTRATGASNTATYTNSVGYIVAAANNQPRFDHSPTTLACNGLLIEESRANFIINSVLAGGGSSPTVWVCRSRLPLS